LVLVGQLPRFGCVRPSVPTIVIAAPPKRLRISSFAICGQSPVMWRL
jgi:hypothetical protein